MSEINEELVHEISETNEELVQEVRALREEVRSPSTFRRISMGMLAGGIMGAAWIVRGHIARYVLGAAAVQAQGARNRLPGMGNRSA
jgi:uncharacterized membrane protein